MRLRNLAQHARSGTYSKSNLMVRTSVTVSGQRIVYDSTELEYMVFFQKVIQPHVTCRENHLGDHGASQILCNNTGIFRLYL